MRVPTLTVLAAAAIVLATGSARASDDELKLRGYGTPVMDGVLTPGEWDAAGHFDFQANRTPGQGGGTVPATLYVMNDSANLYLALRVEVANLGDSAFDGVFAPPGPDSDILRAVPWEFQDLHFHEVTPFTWNWLPDVADGGTQDGTAVALVQGGVGVFEVAHPLNSTDDRHDFSLAIPSHKTFIGSFQHCVAGSCAGTFMPASGIGTVVIVSGTRVPPDTTIIEGPAEGEELPDYGVFVFKGTDDIAPGSEISFECKVDAEDWSSCDNPLGPATTVAGWHTLSVRALDDMLNADPTPAQRRWRIDLQSPSTPRVTRRGKTLRFSSTDRGTPSGRLRFRCAIDTKRLHACGSRVGTRLRGGRHVVRVRAIDPAGNESNMKTLRFTVRRSAA